MITLTKKEKELTATARNLFMKFGIKRVTVEEICDNANTSKMTFYRKFSNKNGIVKAVLDELFKEGMSEYKAIMNQEISFDEKLKHIVELKASSSRNMSQEFINDVMANDVPELQQQMKKLREKNNMAVKKDFKKAQENGDIRADLNIDFALAVTENMARMSTSATLQAFFETPQELIVELTNLFFYGIGPKKSL